MILNLILCEYYHVFMMDSGRLFQNLPKSTMKSNEIHNETVSCRPSIGEHCAIVEHCGARRLREFIFFA
jgi:GMP synthase-like glutamine amidotransferase